jgi:hypothetical protein
MSIASWKLVRSEKEAFYVVCAFSWSFHVTTKAGCESNFRERQLYRGSQGGTPTKQTIGLKKGQRRLPLN